MTKEKNISFDESLNAKSISFVDKMNSQMFYQSDMSSNAMIFDWVDEIEFSIPYLDNIFRNPKVALVREEEVVKVERAKKTSVASIKDLSRHTHFIEKFDEETQEVQPSKILIERNEETFNTYENKFIYTLLDHLYRFVRTQEEILDNLQVKNDKVLEYAASTNTGLEKINIELKISANELPKGDDGAFEKELENIKKRIDKINQFIIMWKKSEMVTSLEKAKVSFISPPIRKTNVILKNPNFQVAMKLYNYIKGFDDDTEGTTDGFDTEGNNVLKGIMNDAFLMNFFVLDSISASKREQKKLLKDYAIIMIHQQIKRVIEMILNSGIKMSDQEIVDLILSELNNEKEKTAVASDDVKNKFRNAFEEYLSKSQNLF